MYPPNLMSVSVCLSLWLWLCTLVLLMSYASRGVGVYMANRAPCHYSHFHRVLDRHGLTAEVVLATEVVSTCAILLLLNCTPKFHE